MFKNAILYRIAPQWAASLSLAEEALAKAPFLECGPTQAKSVGWVAPRHEEHGALVESIGGQWILELMTETKTVPGTVLVKRVKEKAARIEQETGRKPGRKESRELKDEALLDLLPFAFAKQSAVRVWISPAARLLAVDTSSQSRADEVVTLLVESLPGLSLSLLNTKTGPTPAMARWLLAGEAPIGFTVDRECELRSQGEDKATVRYGRHPLDTTEVSNHINTGKLPTLLALTWDDRVSFVLTSGLQLRKLEFLDTVFDGVDSADKGFDADVAIFTGEMEPLIADLILALGGEEGAGV